MSKRASSPSPSTSKKSKQEFDVTDLNTYLKRNCDSDWWLTVERLNLTNNQIVDVPIQLGTLPHLWDLDISRNNIGNSERDDRWHWLMQPEIRRNLTRLNLSNNSIVDLPVELGNLSQLRTLNISRNNIGNSEREDKWSWIMQNEIQQSLTNLDMSFNSITELPENIELNALQDLNISSNRLTHLSYRIGYLNNLTDLSVANNELQNLPAEILYMKRSPRLHILNNPCIINDRNDTKQTSPVETQTMIQVSCATTYNTILREHGREFADRKSARRCYYCEQFNEGDFVREISSFDLLLDNMSDVQEMPQGMEFPRVIVEFVKCNFDCRRDRPFSSEEDSDEAEEDANEPSSENLNN